MPSRQAALWPPIAGISKVTNKRMGSSKTRHERWQPSSNHEGAGSAGGCHQRRGAAEAAGHAEWPAACTVLGLSQEAVPNMQEIQRMFRSLALMAHPDKGQMVVGGASAKANNDTF